MSYLSYLAPKTTEQIHEWLKETLASEYPLLSSRDGEERMARTIGRVYKKDMLGHVRAAIFLSCGELAREFLNNPQDGTDDYAEELMILVDELRLDVYQQASFMVRQEAFVSLSRPKQVAILSVVRKQPHDVAWWMELDQRTGGKLRNQIASCILDRGLSEFIQFMPRLTDEEPLGADILTILLQVRIRHSPDKEQLLQMVREVLPTCCESIKLAVGEWFEEEGIQVASTDGSHVSFSAGMGAMCGAEDANPVYDASVSLTHADGREIGCAKCREMFVAEVKRGER